MDIVKVMEKTINCVFIVLDDNKFGIVTETGLMIMVLCEWKDPIKTLLKDIMSGFSYNMQNAGLEDHTKS